MIPTQRDGAACHSGHAEVRRCLHSRRIGREFIGFGFMRNALPVHIPEDDGLFAALEPMIQIGSKLGFQRILAEVVLSAQVGKFIHISVRLIQTDAPFFDDLRRNEAIEIAAIQAYAIRSHLDKRGLGGVGMPGERSNRYSITEFAHVALTVGFIDRTGAVGVGVFGLKPVGIGIKDKAVSVSLDGEANSVVCRKIRSFHKDGIGGYFWSVQPHRDLFRMGGGDLQRRRRRDQRFDFVGLYCQQCRGPCRCFFCTTIPEDIADRVSIFSLRLQSHIRAFP